MAENALGASLKRGLIGSGRTDAPLNFRPWDRPPCVDRRGPGVVLDRTTVGAAIMTLYRRAFAAVAQHWWYFLVIAVILELGVGFFPESGWMNGASLMIYLIVNYAIYRYHMLGVHLVLLGRPAPSERPEKFWAFAWANVVLLALTVVVIVMLIIAVTTALTLLSYNVVFLGDGEIFPADSAGTIAAITLILLLFYGLILAVFGTTLPASAIGDPFGPRITFHRARHTFWPVVLGLLRGPGLVSALSVGVMLYLTTSVDMPIEMRDLSGAFSPVGLMAALLLQMAGFFGTTLGAIVMCDAYRSTLPTDADHIAATFA
jgi:hypothetical protein